MIALTGENDYSAFFASAARLDTVEENAEEMDKRLARNFGVGLIAGAFPAYKAAKMNPVDALRHE